MVLYITIIVIFLSLSYFTIYFILNKIYLLLNTTQTFFFFINSIKLVEDDMKFDG